MASKGKLNKLEQHYVLTHSDSVAKKAKQLGRTQDFIQKILAKDKTVAPIAEEVIAEEPQPTPPQAGPKPPSAFDFMISKSAKGRGGVMVGTEGVSARADESPTVNKPPRANLQNTYKIHNRKD